MSYHIPYLDQILLISAILFPSGIGGLIALPFQWKARQSIAYSLIGMVSAYMVLLTLILIVNRELVLTFHHAPFYLYLLAPVLGIICLLCEYWIGMLQLYVKTGTLIKRFRVHSAYSNFSKVTVYDILMILGFVIAEELILRQAFFLTLLEGLHLSLWMVIVICAVVYALNHITFGVSVVTQKVMTGLVYTALYYVSGMAIVIPILAHAVQNLTLLALSRKGEKHV